MCNNLTVWVPLNSGGAILNHETPENFKYLCAHNMRNSFVAFAKGDGGIAMLHDKWPNEGELPAAAKYEDLFIRIGKIESWSIAYDLKSQEKTFDCHLIKPLYHKVVKIFNHYFSAGKYYQLKQPEGQISNNTEEIVADTGIRGKLEEVEENSYIGIDRKGRIFQFIGENEKAASLQLDGDLNRTGCYANIKSIYHFFLRKDDESYSLIFDGKKFNPPTIDLDFVKTIKENMVTSLFPDEDASHLEKFKKICEKFEEDFKFYSQIRTMLTSETLDILMRQYASLNEWQKIIDLIVIAKVNNDVVKAALDIAEEKDHEESKFVLNAYGAIDNSILHKGMALRNKRIIKLKNSINSCCSKRYLNAILIVACALFASYLGLQKSS